MSDEQPSGSEKEPDPCSPQGHSHEDPTGPESFKLTPIAHCPTAVRAVLLRR
jgi:hypothetical protein